MPLSSAISQQTAPIPKATTNSKTRPLSTISEASSIYKTPMIPLAFPSQAVEGGSRVDRDRGAPRSSTKLKTSKRSTVFNIAEAKVMVADLQRDVSNSVWSARIEALSRAAEVVVSIHDSGGNEASKLVLSCLDTILEKLDDGNVKVG
jgi:hypothetical protein